MERTKADPRLKEPKHRRRYPWASWFRLDQFVLRRGVDYGSDCKPWAIAQMIRNHAAAHGVSSMKVQIDSRGTIRARIVARFNGDGRAQDRPAGD